MDIKKQMAILEALIFASQTPLTVERCKQVLAQEGEGLTTNEVHQALKSLEESYREKDSALELKEVASGFRFQVRQAYAPWIAILWEEKPPRYSRAVLETLALIAYQQPITRGEIEAVRGVAVSSSIVHSLLDRDWITVVGQRDVPGKPNLYGTTKAFLDYFNLKQLSDLPPLDELQDLDAMAQQLELSLEEEIAIAHAALEEVKHRDMTPDILGMDVMVDIPLDEMSEELALA
ncbi:MAG: SMC-Scp complex subunit ScpB [Gammaproteobacteria bacterium]